MTPTTWIVSANATRARIFCETQPTQPLIEVQDMVNDAARLRTAESETDRMGPTSAGKSIHNTGGATPNKTYQPAATPAQHANELFAKDICEFLVRAHAEQRFDRLAIVASPEFLGVLRNKLPKQLEPLIAEEINKDYTQVPPQQLLDQLAQHRHQHPQR